MTRTQLAAATLIGLFIIGFGYLLFARSSASRTPSASNQAVCATPQPIAYPVPDGYPVPQTPRSEGVAECPTAPIAAYPVPQSSAIPSLADPGTVPLVTIPDANESLPQLVFASQGNLWLSDGRGTPPTQIMNSTLLNNLPGAPVFSPNSRQIAFTLSQPSRPESTVPFSRMSLYVMDANGSNPRLIWDPFQAFLWRPAWSADGLAIYVAANEWARGADASTLTLMRVIVATGEAQPVKPDVVSATTSRDGQWLAVVERVEGYKTELVLTNLAGQPTRVLVDRNRFQEVYAPRFAPNSSQVLFTAVGGPAVDPKGNPVTSASPDPGLPLFGWLMPPVSTAHGESYDLWVVNIDGTGLRRLTWMFADSPIVAYSPDGSEIIINTGTGIYRMQSDGSQLRRIDPIGDHTGNGVDWGSTP